MLELGAGAGLPSIVCALNGAKIVVVTDYPDSDLVENLRHNMSTCVTSADSLVFVEVGFNYPNSGVCFLLYFCSLFRAISGARQSIRF